MQHSQTYGGFFRLLAISPRQLVTLITLLFPVTLQAEVISRPVQYFVGDGAKVIKVLGALQLDSKSEDDTPVFGLSGLAWDEDEQTLYAINDRGRLYHFRANFEDDKLASLDLLNSYRLKDQSSDKLKGKYRDSEGLVALNASNGIKGDTQLLVSFEHHPRIIRYSVKGKYRSILKLPEELTDISNFANPNNALEALTVHPKYGVLTIPQLPLTQPWFHRLYNLDGKSWDYQLAREAANEVTAVETMTDGRLLFIERAYATWFKPLVVTLRMGQFTEQDEIKLTTLERIDSSKDWIVDNFEGLAHHQGRRFFMVSDNNNNFLQKTLLYYFELPGNDGQ